MVDVKPVAWRFELARSRVWVDGRPAEWTDWSRPKVSLVEPCVPEGSIRNLTPLYEQPNTPTEDVVEKVARGIREEIVRQYRDDERGKCPGGAAFYEENVGPYQIARAVLEALGG
jgi:hypothetical protein